MTSSTTPVVSSTNKATRGNDLEELIKEFQSKLGSNWDKYHESLTLFLVGKLSRNELIDVISPMLKDGLRHYHNKLLLLNFANSLKDGPLNYQNEFSTFWNKRSNKSKNVRSSQYEKFKQNIMGLSIKGRRRIKSITRESGKKGKLNASITFTRHALLPKIPTIQNPEQQQLQVNNLVQWQQDVLNGINTPICTETYELPDYENLSSRILMTMREHGLTGGLNPEVLEILLLGLETHLKGIIENAIDVVRYRKNKYTKNDFLSPLGDFSEKNKKRKLLEDDEEEKKLVTINIKDMYDTFEMFPHLIEPSGPKMRLASLMLENDDMFGHQSEYELPPLPETLNGKVKGSSFQIRSDKHYAEENKVSATKETNPQNERTSLMEKQNSNGNADTTKDHDIKIQNQRPQFGTSDELKWILHDLLTTN